MHNVEIRQEIIDRVLARRGRVHLFDSLDPQKTALVIIDMQGTFVEPGSPAEVPSSRGIIDNINELASSLRELGCTIIWVTHANAYNSNASDWDMFFNHFVASDVRQKTIESLTPEGDGQKVWRDLKVEADDLQIIKNGGWHFSYLQSPKNLLKKIASFSHGERNRPEFANVENIEKKIKMQKNIFDL